MKNIVLIAVLAIASPITAYAGESSLSCSATSGPQGNSGTCEYKYTW